jgi:RimJ/RimL family protein N-acetyltransferase
VHWFLFYDENNNVPFGTCYMQSVHNYWRVEKRFYLGGFYISPRYRGNGRFKKLYVLLKKWVSDNGGSQIYVHINERNAKSLAAFKAVGLEEIDYKLLADHWSE